VTALAHAHPVADRRSAAVGRRWLWWSAPAMALSCVALVGLVPSVMGTSWRDVIGALQGVDALWLLVLAATWWGGLCSHSLVLTASLPGLSSRRAIGLNLAGSAVGNTLPLGGAISVGITSSMVRSWGFGTRALGAFLTVSTVANLVVRLVAGTAGLLWLTVSLHAAAGAATTGWLALLVLLCLLVAAGCLASDRTAATVGATLGRSAGRLRAWLRPRSLDSIDLRATSALAGVRVRRLVLRLVLRSWPRLGSGMVAYVALLAVLLDLALRSLGSDVRWPVVLATVAVERLVTAVPVTPGGVGIAELALTSCLVLGGAPAADAAAAALLYRVFTYAIEIPLGLLVAGVWGWARLRYPQSMTRRTA
jgi:putative heme transporter